MANEEHLEILGRGVEEWNAWRKEHPVIEPDLREALLSRAHLIGADLDGAHLDHARLADTSFDGANLDGANLDGASLDRAHLIQARLVGASLDGASLLGANLVLSRLTDASLRGARLTDASLHRASLDSASLDGAILDGASLDGASLDGASLTGVHLVGASLARASLNGAHLALARLGDLDLSEAKGLEEVHHYAPSNLGMDTLSRSEGRIPEVFLRGCGLSDWEIESAKLYNPALSADELTDITNKIRRLRGGSPSQINPLFISCSHADSPFVEALEERLDKKRIRYWRDDHDLKAGRLERQIERATRHNPIVLLVLSERSVDSDWVEWEVSKARELEKEEKREVLCPVALDDAWKSCSWEGPLRRQIEDYHILDFSEWQDAEVIERQFGKLVDGLGLFYPGAE